MNKVFVKKTLGNTYQEIKQPFWKTNTDQNASSFTFLAL